MTVVKTVAAHQIVQRLHPRPVTERDEIGMAEGKAIDGALSRYSHEARLGGRPTHAAMLRLGLDVLDEELRDADLEVSSADRARMEASLDGSLRAFRKSEAFGLARPRSRLVLIDGAAGFYAQPDYWNGRDRFYEMKSYRVETLPPDVELQLQLFQLAFPECAAYLLCIDRHATPVDATVARIPPPAADVATRLIQDAKAIGLEIGAEKVLEFIEGTIVRYRATA